MHHKRIRRIFGYKIEIFNSFMIKINKSALSVSSSSRIDYNKKYSREDASQILEKMHALFTFTEKDLLMDHMPLKALYIQHTTHVSKIKPEES